MYKYEEIKKKTREIVDFVLKPVEFRTSGRHGRKGRIILKGNLMERGLAV